MEYSENMKLKPNEGLTGSPAISRGGGRLKGPTLLSPSDPFACHVPPNPNPKCPPLCEREGGDFSLSPKRPSLPLVGYLAPPCEKPSGVSAAYGGEEPLDMTLFSNGG